MTFLAVAWRRLVSGAAILTGIIFTSPQAPAAPAPTAVATKQSSVIIEDAISAVPPEAAAADADNRIIAARSRSSSSRRGSSSSASSSRSKASSKSSANDDEGHEDGDAASAADVARARGSAKDVPLTTATLPGALEAALRAVLGYSRWGVEVVLAQTGQVLFEHSPNDKFIPASNRKVFTAALALDQLGADYQLRSYFYRTGTLRPDGTLEGNLVVLPSGDPTFSNRLVGKQYATDWIFSDWVAKAKAAGIKQVTGDLIIDCSDWVLTDLAPQGWARRILNDYYAVPPGPLALNENLMGIKVRPGVEAGAPPVIDYFPNAAGYPISNIATTGKGGAAKIERLASGPIQISGVVGSASEVAIPCDNPALFAAAVLRYRLNKEGITLGGTARLISRKGAIPRPTQDQVIAVYESPTMAQLISHMMKHSNNHFAEQLYVTVSAIKSGRGSYTESRRLEDALLRRAGIDTRDLQFGDGSGLSEMNRVSPAQMCQLLNYVARQPYGQAFFDGLAVAGVDGTLRGRMGSIRGRVHGKTGFINGVTCLSGYLTLMDNRLLVFSFMVNDVRGGVGGPKAVQDRLCELLSKLTL